jgi:hypothetical protein
LYDSPPVNQSISDEVNLLSGNVTTLKKIKKITLETNENVVLEINVANKLGACS